MDLQLRAQVRRVRREQWEYRILGVEDTVILESSHPYYPSRFTAAFSARTKMAALRDSFAGPGDWEDVSETLS